MEFLETFSNIIDSKKINLTVIEYDNEPLFFPKEIGPIYGYKDLNNFIVKSDTFEEGYEYVKFVGYKLKQLKELLRVTQSNLQISNMSRAEIMLNECGFTLLNMISNKEFAKKFRRWVTGEVLPSIRKTGQYSVRDRAVDYYSGELKAAIEMQSLFGLTGNQLLLAAVKTVKRFYPEVSEEMLMGEVKLISEKQERLITPTEIGKRIGMSARKANLLLAEKGYQIARRDHNNKLYWELTESGKKFGVYLDTGKQHSDGTPVQQIKWFTSILDNI